MLLVPLYAKQAIQMPALGHTLELDELLEYIGRGPSMPEKVRGQFEFAQASLCRRLGDGRLVSVKNQIREECQPICSSSLGMERCGDLSNKFSSGVDRAQQNRIKKSSSLR